MAPLILVVEDYESARLMYSTFLQARGYRVAEARDGVEAVAKARVLKPDAILMDLSLPVMDGWEATRRIKTDAETKEIPVVAITAYVLRKFGERAREAGADGFLSKPAPLQTIYTELERVMRSASPG
jgi:two-component system, cell cycle response regulator DivK